MVLAPGLKMFSFTGLAVAKSRKHIIGRVMPFGYCQNHRDDWSAKKIFHIHEQAAHRLPRERCTLGANSVPTRGFCLVLQIFFRGEGQRWGDIDRLSSRLKQKDRGRNTDREHEQSGKMPSRRILVW